MDYSLIKERKKYDEKINDYADVLVVLAWRNFRLCHPLSL